MRANIITRNGVLLPLHPSGSTTFGTDTEVAVTISKEYATANRHFTIFPESGRFVLKDLQSGLGTKVNSQPATTTTLVHGDRIQAGQLELVFSDPGQEGNQPYALPRHDPLNRVNGSKPIQSRGESSSIFSLARRRTSWSCRLDQRKSLSRFPSLRGR